MSKKTILPSWIFFPFVAFVAIAEIAAVGPDREAPAFAGSLRTELMHEHQGGGLQRWYN